MQNHSRDGFPTQKRRQIEVDTRSGGAVADPRRQRPEEALHFQPQECRVTLASISDAVITTDTAGQTPAVG